MQGSFAKIKNTKNQSQEKEEITVGVLLQGNGFEPTHKNRREREK